MPFPNPKQPIDFAVEPVLKDVGIAVAVNRSRHCIQSLSHAKNALNCIDQQQLSNVIKYDILRLGFAHGQEFSDRIYIDGVEIPRIEICANSPAMGNMYFSNCMFNELRLDPSVTSQDCPVFSGCMIEVLDGRVSAKDLPTGRFDKCDIETFADDVQTNSSVFKIEAPAGIKILLSILKKLFNQSLSGRDEGAFYRGIDLSYKTIVPEVLAILRKFNFAVKSDKGSDDVWLPIRRKKSEVVEILSAPLM